MLPPSVVNEIRRLLTGEGLSYRKITRITGVSRGTIGKIAAGTRPDYEALRGAWRRSPGADRSAAALSGMRRTGLSSLPPLRRAEAQRRGAGSEAGGDRPRRRTRGRSPRIAAEGRASAAVRRRPCAAPARRDGGGAGALRTGPACGRSTICHRRIEP